MSRSLLSDKKTLSEYKARATKGSTRVPKYPRLLSSGVCWLPQAFLSVLRHPVERVFLLNLFLFSLLCYLTFER